MARLGDLCCFINGDRGKNYPSQAEISSDGEIPFINAGHIVGGKLDFSDMNYISEEKYNQLNSGKIQENDILYCLRGSLGKKAIVKDIPKGAIASSLVIIRPDIQRLNSDYLFYALESPTVQEQMMQANNGSSQPNLSAKSVSDYTFNLPDIKEQLVIVSKLAKVNELIAMRKEQLAKLDQLVKSRFIELFGDTPDEEKKTMADICKIITDGTHQPPKFTSTGIPFLFVSNIVTNEIHYDAEKFISEETYAELIKRTPIAIGDILLSTVGSYGHPAVVKSDKPFCFQRHIAYLKPNADMVNSEYLRGAILSADVQRQIDERVKGIAQKTLNLSEIRKLQLPLPSMEQQEQFAAFVEQTDKSKLAIQYSLNKLELLKKTLMQQYFG